MIKHFFIPFMIACCIAPPLTAYADAVWGNTFLYENTENTQRLERLRFIVDSPDGYVNLRAEPGWDGEILIYPSGMTPRYENGTEIHMEQVYIVNGVYWGIPVIGHYIWEPGWIPMEYLRVMYIGDDFNNEHIDEFYTYTGGYDVAINAEKLVLWQWPGSDREKLVIAKNGFTIDVDSTLHAYRDAEGREWVYVRIEHSAHYFGWYGGKGMYWNEYAWICVSDPENSNIPPFNPAPKSSAWSPDGTLEWIATDMPERIIVPSYPGKNSGALEDDTLTLALIMILVPAFVVCATVFFSYMLCRDDEDDI